MYPMCPGFGSTWRLKCCEMLCPRMFTSRKCTVVNEINKDSTFTPVLVVGPWIHKVPLLLKTSPMLGSMSLPIP